MHRMKCKGCDTDFVALRTDAVTCSPRCRKRYQRMCEQITRDMQAGGFLKSATTTRPTGSAKRSGR